MRSAVNPGLRELIDRAISGESAVDMAEVDEELFYAGYAPLQTVGWTQISFASVKEIKEPRDRLIESMKNSTEELLGTVSEDFNVHSMRLLFGLFVFMFVAIIAVSVIAKKRVRPIEGMTLEVKEFISDGMTFEIRDVYRTGDEIEELAEAFGYMSGKMREYVDEIVKSTAEKEKINAEMEAASQIQLKMLPSIEPDFSGRAEYELYADMDTAKEVGGDFYDFYYLDDDRLVLMIGDVSGKGITAALFMALAKQLIKSQMLLHDGNIVEAMEEANKKLCDESVEAMFVTVWAGVLTLSTGDLEFVNAGHLYAAVRRNGGEFVLEEDKHSFLMGGLSFARYKYNKTTLHDGDVIYLYTDGVTEAHNKENELFGDERLLKALNDVGKAPVEDIDRNVRIKVSAFTDGAEQYDDITTLCFKYKGGN